MNLSPINYQYNIISNNLKQQNQNINFKAGGKYTLQAPFLIRDSLKNCIAREPHSIAQSPDWTADIMVNKAFKTLGENVMSSSQRKALENTFNNAKLTLMGKMAVIFGVLTAANNQGKTDDEIIENIITELENPKQESIVELYNPNQERFNKSSEEISKIINKMVEAIKNGKPEYSAFKKALEECFNGKEITDLTSYSKYDKLISAVNDYENLEKAIEIIKSDDVQGKTYGAIINKIILNSIPEGEQWDINFKNISYNMKQQSPELAKKVENDIFMFERGDSKAKVHPLIKSVISWLGGIRGYDVASLEKTLEENSDIVNKLVNAKKLDGDPLFSAITLGFLFTEYKDTILKYSDRIDAVLSNPDELEDINDGNYEDRAYLFSHALVDPLFSTMEDYPEVYNKN